MSNNYPSLRDQVDPFIPIEKDLNYKPKQPDYEKIKNYKNIE